MSDTNTPVSGFVLSNSLYSKLKFVVQIVMPSIFTFLLIFGQVWEVDSMEKIVATLSGLTVALGAILAKSTSNFNAASGPGTPDGTFNVVTDAEGKKVVTLGFEQDPESLVNGRVLTFQVQADDQDEPREENLP